MLILEEPILDVVPATVAAPGFLDMHSDFINNQITIVGYGRLGTTLGGNGVKRYADEKLQNIGPGWIRPENGDIDECFGDSGGPTFLGSIDETNSGSPTLIGITYGGGAHLAGICNSSQDRHQRVDSAGDAQMVQCLLNDTNGTSVAGRCSCDKADIWTPLGIPGFCEIQAFKFPGFPYFDPDTQ